MQINKRSIVRVLDSSGRFVGLGCLLSEEIIITCAHNVRDALGFNECPEQAPEELVKIDFPFVDKEKVDIENSDIENLTVCAKVSNNGWFPGTHHSMQDIAILRLEGNQRHQLDFYPQLTKALPIRGIEFIALGGIKGHEENLIDIEGKTGEILGNNRQRLDVSSSNYKIEYGCSGAPVFDAKTGNVIGLIVQDEKDKTIPAGFMIHAQQLKRALLESRENHDFATPSNLNEIKTWINQISDLKSRDINNLCRFVDIYVGTESNRIPFVGRASTLVKLDAWLSQNSKRFLLLTGVAGRGKSALLLHWILKLLSSRTEIELMFLPISIRTSTNTEVAGLRILHAWLATYFNDLRFSQEFTPNLDDYRDRIFDGWKRIKINAEKRYLLIVDGADETTNNWLLNEVLPSEVPNNFHILIAARHKPTETDGLSWIDDFGFSDRTIIGEPIDLEKLKRTDVQDAILQLERSLDQLVDKKGFTEEIYRLTDKGDPLLVTLWIGQIWNERSKFPNFSVQELKDLQPNFEGFFKQWFIEQESIWKDRKIEAHRDEVLQVFELMSVAKGPLLLGELFELLCRDQMTVRITYEALRAVMETSSRLVTGDGKQQGYAFVHPRLGFFFQDNLRQKRKDTLNAVFMDWGAKVCSQLNQDTLSSEDCPEYLIHHYLDHLELESELTEGALEKYWLPLIEQGWHLAWYEMEGAWDGYINDINRVAKTLHKFNKNCLEEGEIDTIRLAELIRVCLIRASVYTLTKNVPAGLIIYLVRYKVWSVERCLRTLNHFGPKSRLEISLELLDLASTSEKKRTIHEVLTAARQIKDDFFRQKALCSVAKHLEDPPYRKEVLEEALTAARQIKDDFFRQKALCSVAKHLEDPPYRKEVLEEALSAARQIQDEFDRQRTLCAVAQQLEDPLRRQEVLEEALAAARQIKYESFRQVALSAVAQQLEDPLRRQEVLEEALAAARQIKYKSSRHKALCAVAEHLEDPLHRREVLEEALTAARQINDESSRHEALCAVAQHLKDPLQRQEVLEEALTAARQIQNGSRRQRELCTVAEHLKDPLQRQEVLEEALSAARQIQNGFSRQVALCAVAQHLKDPLQRQEVLEEALTAARQIQDESFRQEALSAVAQHLKDPLQRQEVLEEALAAACQTRDESTQEALRAELAQLKSEPKLLKIDMEAARENFNTRLLIEVLDKLYECEPSMLVHNELIHIVEQLSVNRPELLDEIGDLCGLINTLFGNRELPEIARAISDTSRWWP